MHYDYLCSFIQMEFMIHNAETFMTVNAKQLYTEFVNEYENRPVLVFLHDSLGCTQLWRNFPHQLAAATQCNVLIYDRLGYGKSDPMPTHERAVNYMELEADVLQEILTKLKITNAILFGHSDGGTIALLAAAKYPGNIAGVICEAGHIFVEDVTLKGIYEAMDAYKNTTLPERLKKYHGEKTETLFRAWTETWTGSDYRNWNIEHFLPKISCPLLFIQGEKDEYGTMDQVNRTISQVSGRSEKYIIPETGHTPHKESPELTLKAAESFINSILKD